MLFKTCFSLLLAAVISLASAAEDEKQWDVNNPALTAPVVVADIDVTEGTWISLDVSPDGQSLVFDLLGDIYQLPITGGEATPLTSGHAWDIQPRFSADGKQIAFTSDRAGGDNIWVLDVPTGQLRQITHESFRLLNSPSWSPDGQYIAARKHFTTSRSLGTGEVWLYHAGGGEGQQGQLVVERPAESFQKELGEPVFAPDGSAIYFTRNVSPGNTFVYHEDSNGELFQIRKRELATGKEFTVVGGAGGAVRPTPSPDGKSLAYVKRVRARSRLFVMDLVSGRERMVFDALDQDMQETWAVHGMYPNMDWTPDSKQIVFWAQGKIWTLAVESGQLVEIPFRVRDQRSVYTATTPEVEVAPATFNTKMARFAQVAPNGSDAVFESLGRLYIKRDDQAPTALTRDRAPGFDYAPVWSTDGRQVYFLRWTDSGLTSLHRVSAQGGKSRSLALRDGQYTELALSIDGKSLALRKLAGSSLLTPEFAVQPGLYLYQISSGESQFVSTRGQQPHFGPNNRLYALERRESAVGRGSSTAKTRLISMTLQGLDIREHAEADYATAIRLSPSGKYIAFIDKFQVYVTPAVFTGKPLVLDADSPAFPRQRLSLVGGDYLSWSSDSRRVMWSTGPTLKMAAVTEAFQPNYVAPQQGVDLSLAAETEQPRGRSALVNARIITMNKNREVIEQGTLLVDGNRIAALGHSDAISIPADYQRIDMTGKTLVPGFIDAHAHGPYGRAGIIPQQNWSLLGHLALGVTTLHDPAGESRTVFAAAEYARAGKILAPRIFSTGEIVYGAKSTSWAPVDNLDDALAHVRRLKAQGAISIKNYNQPRREQRQQVNEAAYQEGLLCVAEGGSLFQMDMNLIADGIGGIEHNVPTLKVYNDVNQFWRQSAAGYTPTLVVTYGGLTAEDYYYQESAVWRHPILANFVPPAVLQARAVRRPMAPESDYRDVMAASAAKTLLEQGVKVNIGAHGQREGLAAHWEMWSFARGGFSAMQSLSAATINPATYLGMDKDLGSLERGKLADLVVLDDNPLVDIRHTDNISQVVLNGRIYDAQTLSEVYSGNSRLAPFYWQGRPGSDIR